MKRATNRVGSIQPPLREAWDFDLGGCPAEELEHCCFYEYALETSTIREAVLLYRNPLNRPKRTTDVVRNLILDSWFGSPYRVLVDCVEFPEKHWLQIDPASRRQIVTKTPPVSSMSVRRNHQPKYDGPQPADIEGLKGEMTLWEPLVAERQTLLVQFIVASRSTRLIRGLPNRWRGYLTKWGLLRWRRKLSKLQGEELNRVANKLFRGCQRRIERRYRHPRELIVYDVDWTKRPRELVDEFRQWEKINRVHNPRPRSGGHPTKPVELLKALGAKRLLDFFRKHQKGLPPYDVQTLEGGLESFTVCQRKAASRPAEPLCKARKGWVDAERIATQHLAKVSS